MDQRVSDVKLLNEIATRVRHLDPQLQIILLMDCAKQHIHTKISVAARRQKIWIVYVPAKLTWLLQPCDTHVFAAYKRQMQREYDDERASTSTGHVTYAAWMLAIARTIVKVLESTAWQRAFAETGWTEDHMDTSFYILRHLDPAATLPALCDRPHESTLRACLPSNMKLNVLTLLPRMPAIVAEAAPSHARSLPPASDMLLDALEAQEEAVPARVGPTGDHLAGAASSSSHRGAEGEPCPAAPAPSLLAEALPPAVAPGRMTSAPLFSQDGPISRRTRSKSFVSDSVH